MAGPVVVAVDGIDGSGKSVLADRLAAGIRGDGDGVALLRVDDFRRSVDWSRPDKSELDLYYDDYYDLPLLDRCLRACLDGARAVDVAVWDGAREEAGGTRRLDLEGVAIALVEGVFVQRLAAVSAAAAAVIYVQATPAEARRRILARDVARGRAAAEVERRIDARYFPAQRRYEAACDPAGRAAVVIDNENPKTPRALRLATERVPAPVARALARILTA
jgi:uridine kinase